MDANPFLAQFFESKTPAAPHSVSLGTQTMTRSREDQDTDMRLAPPDLRTTALDGTMTGTAGRESPDTDEIPPDRQTFARQEAVTMLGTETLTEAREDGDTDFTRASLLGTSTMTKSDNENGDADATAGNTDFMSAVVL